MGLVGRVLLTLVLLLSLALTARLAWVAYGPRPDSADLAAQVRFLNGAIADGQDRRMQERFPEGRFFTVALTALAEAATPTPDLSRLRERLALLESPELTAPFGSGMTPGARHLPRRLDPPAGHPDRRAVR